MPTISFAGQTLTIDHAYSYARVSSKQQTADQGGHGIDRQELLSQEWSSRYGVPLDHELRDLGRSGSKGHHLKKGAALGAFLDAVKSGTVRPNSALLVESFSRLSRLPIDDALSVFLDIIRNGVTLITLQDQSAYTRKSVRDSAGEMHKVTALLQASRTEAEMKAYYVRRSWTARRQRVTKVCPAWLIIVDGLYVARPEAVAIIIYIFEQCRDGVGLDRIAANLNAKGVPPFSGRNRGSAGWYDSYIRKLITQRAVRGETTEHRYEEGDRRVTTDKTTKPYPEVVSESLWQAANGSLAGRRAIAGAKGREFTNLLSGLAVCSCGAPMRIRVKGNRNDYTYYQCRDAKRGLCSHREYINYRPIERVFLSQFGAIVLLVNQPPDNAASELAEQIALTRREAAEIELEYERLAKVVQKGGTLGARRLASLESDYATKLADVAKLEKAATAATVARPLAEEMEAVRRLIAGLDRVSTCDRYATRAKINDGLKRLLKAVTFLSDGSHTVTLADGFTLPQTYQTTGVNSFGVTYSVGDPRKVGLGGTIKMTVPDAVKKAAGKQSATALRGFLADQKARHKST